MENQNPQVDPKVDNQPKAVSPSIPDKFKKEDGSLDIDKVLGSYGELEKLAGRLGAEKGMLLKEVEQAKNNAVEVKPVVEETKKDVVELTTAELDAMVQGSVMNALKSKQEEESKFANASNTVINAFNDSSVKALFGSLDEFDQAVVEEIKANDLFKKNDGDPVATTEDAMNRAIAKKVRAPIQPTNPPQAVTDAPTEVIIPSPTGAKIPEAKTRGKELFDKGRETGNFADYMEYIATHPEERIVSEFRTESI